MISRSDVNIFKTRNVRDRGKCLYWATFLYPIHHVLSISMDRVPQKIINDVSFIYLQLNLGRPTLYQPTAT